MLSLAAILTGSWENMSKSQFPYLIIPYLDPEIVVVHHLKGRPKTLTLAMRSQEAAWRSHEQDNLLWKSFRGRHTPLSEISCCALTYVASLLKAMYLHPHFSSSEYLTKFSSFTVSMCRCCIQPVYLTNCNLTSFTSHLFVFISLLISLYGQSH